MQQEPVAPALEGLRTGERRTRRLLDAWLDAAALVAGPDDGALGARRSHCSSSASCSRCGRRGTRGAVAARRCRASGASWPRRSIAVRDAFLAIDVETGAIADANPAAGSLLGTTRDRLLGCDAMTYVPDDARELWWTQLDAVSEGAEPRRFLRPPADAVGRALSVDATVTRFGDALAHARAGARARLRRGRTLDFRNSCAASTRQLRGRGSLNFEVRPQLRRARRKTRRRRQASAAASGRYMAGRVSFRKACPAPA